MTRVPIKLLLLVGALFLLFLFTDLRSPIIENNEIPDQQIKISTQLNAVVSQSEIESIKKEIEKALHYIPPILGIEYKKNIKVKIVDEGICDAKEDIILLPILHLRDKSAVIIHEVTHIIAKHENNSFFSEGLAVYFQERFGGFDGFPNYSVPLDYFVRSNKEQLLQITKLKNDNRIFEQLETEQRRMAYIEAGSFINYLVVRYGEQKLAELHNSKSLNYKEVYGSEIQKLEAEWKNYVFGEPLMK